MSRAGMMLMNCKKKQGTLLDFVIRLSSVDIRLMRLGYRVGMWLEKLHGSKMKPSKVLQLYLNVFKTINKMIFSIEYDKRRNHLLFKTVKVVNVKGIC